MALMPFKTPSEFILDEHSKGPVGDGRAEDEFTFSDENDCEAGTVGVDEVVR